MLRLTGKVLNIEEKNGTNKEGKPYFFVNFLVLDDDNDVTMVRVFDRDGTLKINVKGIKIGSVASFGVDQVKRLENRTLDAVGQYMPQK